MVGSVFSTIAISIGIKDSNEAEFLAIVFALKQSLDKEWLSSSNIIVKSDSKNALAWVNNCESCPWSLREANSVADELEKKGSSMEGTWIQWY
ncbi:hypothetical protein QL285_008590 [Trifolium repens]|nr:hypothetical protein QL285_008590 [Trifolium repens]